MSIRNNALAGRESPVLCYVTDRRALGIANAAESVAALSQKIEEVAAAGVDWVQIREKDLTANELTSLTRQTLRIAANLSAKRSCAIRVLVNDRLDVAIAERADGVHLGEKSLPVREARRLLQSAPPKQDVGLPFLVGVSCHSTDAAEGDGADYVFFGPIFETPSKLAFGRPQGLERLAQVCRTVAIPVIAIGGITLENTASCIRAGAAGIAAIRLFQETHTPEGLIGELRRLIA